MHMPIIMCVFACVCYKNDQLLFTYSLFIIFTVEGRGGTIACVVAP